MAALNANKLPTPRINKVVVERQPSNNYYRFNLDIDLDGVFKGSVSNSSKGNSLSSLVKNSDIKIAVVMFELGEEAPNSLRNLIKDMWGVNFLPLASDFVLQDNPNTSYSKMSPNIKIYSLRELYNNNSLSIKRDQSTPKIWTANIPRLEFLSNKESLKHVSFCVMPFIVLSDTSSSKIKSYSKSSIKHLKGGTANSRSFVKNHYDRSNPDRCLVYDYYSYDFVIAIENGRVIKDGILLAQRDNDKIWTGPSHIMENGTYMTGRYHGDLKLPEKIRDLALRQISIPYGRVQDQTIISKTNVDTWTGLYDVYSFRDFITTLQEREGSKKDSFVLKTDRNKKFTRDFSTLDKQYSYNTLFTLDIVGLLATNTSLPVVMDNLVEDLNDEDRIILKKIISLSTIESCEITRRQVKDNAVNYNKLATPASVMSEIETFYLSNNASKQNSRRQPKSKISFSDNSKGMVEEIKNFSFQKDVENNFLRTFSFKETVDVDKSYGSKYQYNIKLSIKDGVLLYARELILELLAKYAAYSNKIAPVLEINKNDHFSSNLIASKFGPDFIGEFNNNVLMPLLGSLGKTIKFFSSRSINSSALQRSFFVSSNFVTGTRTGVDVLRSSISDFVETLSKMTNLNLKVKNSYNFVFNENNELILEQFSVTDGDYILTPSEIHHTNFNTQLVNTFVHTEDFESVLENPSFAGYEFISNNINPSKGIKTIKQSEFNNRVSKEMAKYYNSEGLKQMNVGGSNAIPIQKNQTRFFTPSSFKLGDKLHNINSSFNVSSLEMTYKNLLDILYYKEKMTCFTCNDSAGISILVDRLTSIDIEENTILSNSATTDRPMSMITDVGSLSSRKIGVSVEPANWTNLENSQGANMDQINIDADYESRLLQNRDGSDLSVLNFILSNRILFDKTTFVNSYSSTAEIAQKKIYNSTTPPQTISALLEINVEQLTSVSGIMEAEGNLINNALKKKEVKLTDINSKSLFSYGLQWFNYDNMVQVYFCSSVDEKDGVQWLPLTNEIYEASMRNGNALLCKLERKTDLSLNQIGNEYLELPIFNDVFIIQSSEPVNKIIPRPVDTSVVRLQRSAFKITDLANKYSSDFYRFIQPNVPDIMGTPSREFISEMKTNSSTGAIRAFVDTDPESFRTTPKSSAPSTSTKAVTTRGGY